MSSVRWGLVLAGAPLQGHPHPRAPGPFNQKHSQGAG